MPSDLQAGAPATEASDSAATGTQSRKGLRWLTVVALVIVLGAAGAAWWSYVPAPEHLPVDASWKREAARSYTDHFHRSAKYYRYRVPGGAKEILERIRANIDAAGSWESREELPSVELVEKLRGEYGDWENLSKEKRQGLLAFHAAPGGYPSRLRFKAIGKPFIVMKRRRLEGAIKHGLFVRVWDAGAGESIVEVLDHKVAD